MKIRAATLIAATAALSCLSARGESIRCSQGAVSEGESRLSVAFKCGSPLAQDSFCKPVVNPVPYPVPSPSVPGYVAPVQACEQIDEWLYDRGPGNLMVKLRFRSAVLESIDYGRFPR